MCLIGACVYEKATSHCYHSKLMSSLLQIKDAHFAICRFCWYFVFPRLHLHSDALSTCLWIFLKTPFFFAYGLSTLFWNNKCIYNCWAWGQWEQQQSCSKIGGHLSSCSRGLFHSSDLTNLSFDHKLLSWCTLMKLWVCIFFTAVWSWVNELQVWVMCVHHGDAKPTLMEAWHYESPWQLSTRGRPCTLVCLEEAILILKVWRYCQICGTDWRSVGVSGRRQKEFIE